MQTLSVSSQRASVSPVLHRSDLGGGGEVDSRRAGLAGANLPPSCSLIDLAPKQETFAEAIRAGLARGYKSIPPQFLYDKRGTALFNCICETPEYYVTRTELSILRDRASEIAECVGPLANLIEFGAGSEAKVLTLLGALKTSHSYVPIDVSLDALAASATAVSAQYPEVQITAIRTSFLEAPTPPMPQHGRRVAFFPGSTIGNLRPEAACELLRMWRPALREDGLMLVGVDLRKDPVVIRAAYNDSAGVTEAFIRNILARANREVGGEFDERAFNYVAEYDAEAGCVQLLLESKTSQNVFVGNGRVPLSEGERIHIEDSWKYSIDGFHSVARRAGYEPCRTWTDPHGLFSVHLLGV